MKKKTRDFILSTSTDTYPSENSGQTPSEGTGTTYAAKHIGLTHY